MDMKAFSKWYDAVWLGDQQHGQYIPRSGDPDYDRYLEGHMLALGAWIESQKQEREACAKVCEETELAFDIDIWCESTKKEMTAHTANGLADAIRAIDPDKLAEKA